MEPLLSTPRKKKSRTKSISEQIDFISLSPSHTLINKNENNNNSNKLNPILDINGEKSEQLLNDEISTIPEAKPLNDIVNDLKLNHRQKSNEKIKINEEEFADDESSDLSDNEIPIETESPNNDSLIIKVENYTSIILIILEQIISSITFLLPNLMIDFFTKMSRYIFKFFKSNNEKYNEFLLDNNIDKKDELLNKVEKLRKFKNFSQICALNNFKSESHLIKTDDGFLLSVHRLNPEINGFKSNGKSIYFQHGLLMTSDVWCVMLNKDDNLPFRLCELGYDVWLGNNRGNKYSNKHIKYNANEAKYWDFSIDEFAMYDIPASINYILNIKNDKSLIYIGFSQGCSQILSSISINNDLNDKIEKLILIAPATTPKKLSNWLINSIISFKPSVMYMLFGKKILMKSVMFWRRITYPPMFIKLIDMPNDLLFNWKSKNIDIIQKLISYYHLYSTTSVKCVVHWFQIIKSKKFQMYQEQDYFQSFEYPTNYIKIEKLMIIYGMNDSLVDIDIIVNQLPKFKKTEMKVIKDGILQNELITIDNTGEEEIIEEGNNNVEKSGIKLFKNDSELRIFAIDKYEHLDLLWGRNMNNNVIKNVIEFIK